MIRNAFTLDLVESSELRQRFVKETTALFGRPPTATRRILLHRRRGQTAYWHFSALEVSWGSPSSWFTFHMPQQGNPSLGLGRDGNRGMRQVLSFPEDLGQWRQALQEVCLPPGDPPGYCFGASDWTCEDWVEVLNLWDRIYASVC